MKFDQNMDHLEIVNPPTSSHHGLELVAINEGKNDELCSVQYLLTYDMKYLQVSQPAESARERLQVFFPPESMQNQIQQKIVSVMLSLPESGFMETFNMVQFWAPSTSSRNTILSVSKQPFGVDRIRNGVCEYRFFSVQSSGEVYLSDPVGRAFISHSPELFVNCFQDLSQQRSVANRCGFMSSWVIPLVDVGGCPAPCVGVVQFLSRGDIRFDSTLVDKIQKLTGHVYGALNCPSDTGNYSSPHSLRHFVSANVDPRLETVDAKIATASESEIDHGMVPYDQSFAEEFGFVQTNQTYDIHADHDLSLPDLSAFSFSDDEYAANLIYGQNQLGAEASTSNTDAHIVVVGDTGDEQLLEAAAEEDTRFTNVTSYETSGSITEGLKSWGSANDDRSSQGTPESTVSMKTRTVGIPKITKAMIEQYFGRNLKDAAEGLGVSRSTLKRYCRSNGYPRWPSHKRHKVNTLQNPMTVKATYGTEMMRFVITSDVNIEVLRVELGRRFGLEIGTFIIQYQDDAGDLITIPCNEDLWYHLNTLNSAKQETMHLLLSLAI